MAGPDETVLASEVTGTARVAGPVTWTITRRP